LIIYDGRRWLLRARHERPIFLGSNAGHVVRSTTCSVLVMRQQPG